MDSVAIVLIRLQTPPHDWEGSRVGGRFGEILNRFVEVVGTIDERVRFLDGLWGIVVGVAILCLSRGRGVKLHGVACGRSRDLVDKNPTQKPPRKQPPK